MISLKLVVFDPSRDVAMATNFYWFRSQAASGAAGRANFGLRPGSSVQAGLTRTFAVAQRTRIRFSLIDDWTYFACSSRVRVMRYDSWETFSMRAKKLTDIARLIHGTEPPTKKTNCHINGGDSPHRRRRIDRSMVFVRWCQCARPSSTRSLWPTRVCLHKRHLDLE